MHLQVSVRLSGGSKGDGELIHYYFLIICLHLVFLVERVGKASCEMRVHGKVRKKGGREGVIIDKEKLHLVLLEGEIKRQGEPSNNKLLGPLLTHTLLYFKLNLASEDDKKEGEVVIEIGKVQFLCLLRGNVNLLLVLHY